MSSKEILAIKESLSQLLEHETIKEFASIWDAIGIEDRIRQERRDKMFQYHCNLQLEMLEEERSLKKRLEDSIKSCSEELVQLETQLHLSSTLDSYSLKTITEKERLIRERVDALNKIKHDRMKRLKRLIEMETVLAHGIGEKPSFSLKWQSENLIPSEEELQNYLEKVEQLESIKDQRQVEFRNVRDKARAVWAELETEPTDELGLRLYSGDISHFVFSQANMKSLEDYYQKLESSATEQEKEANYLRNCITSLWKRLEIPTEFREEFLSQHQGYKDWVIKELKSEVDRLDILKQFHLEGFIKATRAELAKVWDQCMFGENQKREFGPAFNDDFTEDNLSAHESELDKMRGFYADNNEIFKLVEKRESLWDQKIEMDNRANDPARLNNRGGKLLQEQRLHQKINKDLPKTEKKLKEVLTQWEEDHTRHFIIKDQRYLDNLDSRWEEYHQSKEQEKIKRQQIKAETTVMEMKFGSKPQTPTPKRKAVAPVSNDRAPKVARVTPAPSPLVKATTNKITPARRLPRHQNKVLKDKNKSNPATPEPGFDFSLASAGSYTDFQRAITFGPPNNRSSVVSTKSSKANVS
ncbi:PREDICTED: protein regulator of cytokinesis 1-like isoform X1 [Amphimedon queenslandica]|uniref:Protein regulator of cytokinesis 1 n=1 Tax=Amphimedon queenslandica TaxID=400682 RepID=A0A1X7VCX6_AMPQE|nr:PREDICTED: protein regulator of cytokinesis 1-like isoform X1 [Amphimedon queenslandica]|eukprot:XP_019849406.1 PREDICTED: protein regulator of cytokinesis 1-like isoform X1 [Amphimedon queenslandica]